MDGTLQLADDVLEWMALADLGARGTAAWLRAAAQAGSARALFAAGASDLRALGLSAEKSRAILRYRDWPRLRNVLADCTRRGIRVVPLSAPDYPALLRQIADPPCVLYCRGIAPARLAPGVAVVGSRRASRYGRRTAEIIAAALAEAGVAVISGLAFGVDESAHEGALAVVARTGGCCGRTAAVLAGGLDCIYPSRNVGLFGRVAEVGCVLSEHPPGTAPLPYLFPVRNRIITGMCAATVVVEAAARSGSLVSARLAAEQGREVLAVPGNIDAPTARGTNALIRDGCTPVVAVEDVLAAVGVVSAVPVRREKTIEDRQFDDPDVGRLVSALDTLATGLDDLIESTGLDGARIMELLTALELEGVIERSSGGGFALRTRKPPRGR